MSTVSTTSDYRRPIGSVQSHISWGAILAGAVVALAIYSLLNILGIAVGFSVSDNVDRNQLGTGAAIWAFVSLMIALFIGGWVTTQCTLGENRTEAILYGVVLWGVTCTLILWLTAMGLRMGYDTVVRDRGVAAADPGSMVAPRKGAPPVEQDVDSRRERATAASWWAFAGTLLSMIAAIAGALMGPYEFVVKRELRGRVDDRGSYDRPPAT